MRILIAEDDVTSRAMLKAVLEHCGHKVVQTTNGAEAWDAMRQPQAPGLAILDWMMPELEGVDLVRRIRALGGEPRPYLIMLTTKTEKADIVAGLDAGADDYLVKPFDAGELRARIEVGRRVLEAQDALAAKVAELEDALAQIRTLRGILPICAKCKKVRDDDGYWHQVEVYLRNHTSADFSHGICPDCLRELYPELAWDEGSDNAGRKE